MDRKFIFILAVSIICMITNPTSAAVRYNLTDLGTLGGNWSFAYSINNNGQIVGHSGGSSTLFDPTGFGDNIPLGTLGGQHGGAWSINNNGRTVGWADIHGGRPHAALFGFPSGGNTDLGTLGGSYSCAYSINDMLQIVGLAGKASGGNHATLFDHTGGGNNIDLGTLGGDYSCAYSINNNGQVVGLAADVPGSGYHHATLFEPGNPANNISLTPGWMGCAFSINDSGQIVGFVGPGPAAHDILPMETHATLFDPSGSGNNIYLGALGGEDSCAYSINNNGQIVGIASTGLGIQMHACLFDSSGGGNNIDLNNMIDPNLGWELQYAYCINDNGYIVGIGYNPDGHHRAFLLTPMSANTGPAACIMSGDWTIEATGQKTTVTLDGSCSSDVDSNEGTNDDIEYFDWYEIVDGNDPNSDIFLGRGEVIDCNLALGEHNILLEVIDKADETDSNEVTISIVDTTPPVITLNGSSTIVLECGVDSYTEQGATALDLCDGIVAVVIGGDTVDTTSCGVYEVTYDATDTSGNSAVQVIRTVIVQDTTPPEFSLSVAPEVLWPANHKMVEIRPEWTVSDLCDEDVEVRLVSVTSNEGDNGKGDGNTSDDIQIIDDSIYLRAEHSGRGNSRIYTITYEAVDDSGNLTQQSATVTVPHDRGKG